MRTNWQDSNALADTVLHIMPPRPVNPSRQPRRLGSFNRDVELGDRFSDRSLLPNTDKAGLPYSKSQGDLAGQSLKSLPQPHPSTIGERKKSTYTRKVLKFSSTGQSSLMEANKVSITHALGVQSRDLRLLDPQLATSYPSAILCRDQALIVNCEQVKCIITRHYLLLLNPEDDTVRPFVEVGV